MDTTKKAADMFETTSALIGKVTEVENGWEVAFAPDCTTWITVRRDEHDEPKVGDSITVTVPKVVAIHSQPNPAVLRSCSICNWTNVSLINLGEPNKPRMVCQGCCKRAVDTMDEILALTQNPTLHRGGISLNETGGKAESDTPRTDTFYDDHLDFGYYESDEWHKFASQLERELAVARKGLEAVASLMDESHGVDGLHLNGDLAPWDELRTGGRFEEWLVAFDDALNAARSSNAQADRPAKAGER